MKRLFICLLLYANSLPAQETKATYTEKYRPQFHFTPAVNWTNDPNGLLYFNQEYHLFYQYNPFGNTWGHMTWAHAVSKDLLHWQHLPLAIREENRVMIFSGSTVADYNNTSGFASKKGQVPLIAIYTGHFIADPTKPDNYSQAQYIAYSHDNGRTWTKYNGNPVLDQHKKDFRDPKVFWYAPQKKWVMAAVLPQEHIVQFYSSSNLKEWTLTGQFGPAGDIKDIWECPDLLQVPVHGQPGVSKWVLFNSQQTTMQYFVGTFDGSTFTNENPSGNIYRPDYGPDYYAAITYNQLPADRGPVLLGWANNWTYAKDIPTYPWRSAMSLPRELSLEKINTGWILRQRPLFALQKLRTGMMSLKNMTVAGNLPLLFRSQQMEADVLLQPAPGATCGIRLATGNGHELEIGYNAIDEVLYMDRSKTANQSFNASFQQQNRFETKLLLKDNRVRLHVFFDNSMVEVFANDGEVVMTMQLFPDANDSGVALFSTNGVTQCIDIKCWQMKTTWK